MKKKANGLMLGGGASNLYSSPHVGSKRASVVSCNTNLFLYLFRQCVEMPVENGIGNVYATVR